MSSPRKAAVVSSLRRISARGEDTLVDMQIGTDLEDKSPFGQHEAVAVGDLDQQRPQETLPRRSVRRQAVMDRTRIRLVLDEYSLW